MYDASNHVTNASCNVMRVFNDMNDAKTVKRNNMVDKFHFVKLLNISMSNLEKGELYHSIKTQNEIQYDECTEFLEEKDATILSKEEFDEKMRKIAAHECKTMVILEASRDENENERLIPHKHPDFMLKEFAECAEHHELCCVQSMDGVLNLKQKQINEVLHDLEQKEWHEGLLTSIHYNER